MRCPRLTSLSYRQSVATHTLCDREEVHTVPQEAVRADVARPLAGLIVVEITATPAAAFAAALAADHGATVIVCEPAEGSPLRRLGPESVQAHWWAALGRGKLSLCLDEHKPEFAAVRSRLEGRSGILFRDEWAFAHRLSDRLGPQLLDVCLHATGADRRDLWPWSTRSEFAAAASGVMALTGAADGFGVAPELPLADYCAGTLALSAALAELRAARLADRTPRPLRFGLHEALMRMNEWQVAIASGLDRAERRNGNRFPMNSNIGNIFKTSDGRLITVSAATQPVAARFLAMIGGPALAQDPRFATPAARRENMDALDAEIATWIGARPAADVLRMARECDVVVGPVHDAGDIEEHPQVVARANVVVLDGRPMPAITPRQVGRDQSVPRHAPRIGEHSEAVLETIGFEPEEAQALLETGAVKQG